MMITRNVRALALALGMLLGAILPAAAQADLTFQTSGTVSGLNMALRGNTIAKNLATMLQGGTAPTTTSTGLASLAGIWWHDTSHKIIFIRDQADANWLAAFYLDETGHLAGVSSQAGAWVTVGGTANAVTLAYPVAPAAYVQGLKVAYKAASSITGALTVNVNSLGAKNVYKKTGSGVAAVASGDIQSGDLVELEYDGTQFQVISGLASSLGTVTSVGDATNGGVSVAGGTAAATIALAPSDLVAKTTPTTSDILMLGDAAASFAGKKSTIAQLQAVAGWGAFSAKFNSTAQTVPAAAVMTTIAHGLGQRPTHVVAVLRNVTTEGGWSPGTEIPLMLSGSVFNGTSNASWGFGLGWDATNIYVVGGNAQIEAVGANGAIFAVTAANWQLFVRAWY